MSASRAVADMGRWVGRVDVEEGEEGRRWHQIVQPLGAQSEGIALLGFASDAGVARNHGRPGAAGGPAATRAMLANLPVRDCVQIVDAGDVTCVDDDLEAAQAELAQTLTALLGRGLLPVVLGGGHEVAFGSFSGLAQHLTGEQCPRIGIVNLDAHLDLRLAERANSGTPFRQIAEECARRGWPFHYCCLGVSEYANTRALFNRAARLGVTWLRDEDMGEGRIEDTLAVFDHFARGVDHLYLTICLDVLPAAVAPGVSAPAARGIALSEVEAIADRAVGTRKLRLADIAELNPRFDIDNQTARVAARLAARVVEGAWCARPAAAGSIG